jgi:hypothetical protein
VIQSRPEFAMDKPCLEVATERLDRLERDNRRLVWVLLAVFAGAVLVLVERTNLIRRGTIEAEGLVLRDKTGAVRARLGLRADGSPELALCDTRGQDQIMLETSPDDTASLSFLGQGRPLIFLASSRGGWANLRLLDRENKSTSSMYMMPDSTTGIAFNRGKDGVHLALPPDGVPRLTATDENGDECNPLSDGLNAKGTGTATLPGGTPSNARLLDPHPTETEQSG